MQAKTPQQRAPFSTPTAPAKKRPFLGAVGAFPNDSGAGLPNDAIKPATASPRATTGI